VPNVNLGGKSPSPYCTDLASQLIRRRGVVREGIADQKDPFKPRLFRVIVDQISIAVPHATIHA
jgi:hypothetical protein